MPAAADLGVDRVTKRRNGERAGALPVADSRPFLVEGRVAGSRCTSCRYPSAQRGLPWCPVCYAQIVDDTFSAEGIAWSSVTVAIPVNDRPAPFSLAFVDLDDGPRVLARLDHPAAVAPNTRVAIVGIEAGDLIASSALPAPADHDSRSDS